MRIRGSYTFWHSCHAIYYSRMWSMAWDVSVASRENLRLIHKFIMGAEYRKSWLVVDKLLFCYIYFTLPALDQCLYWRERDSWKPCKVYMASRNLHICTTVTIIWWWLSLCTSSVYTLVDKILKLCFNLSKML